jgi:hypothetical protein
MTYCESCSLPRVTLQGWFGRGLIVVPKEIGGALAIAIAIASTVTPTRVRSAGANSERRSGELTNALSRGFL